jgi:catechol 1,2-dioxygenase
MGQMIPDHASRAALDPKPNDTSKKPQYDPTFTDRVIAATGPNANRRLAEVMPSLVRHLHAFAREVNLTVAEWTATVEFVSNDTPLSAPPIASLMP